MKATWNSSRDARKIDDDARQGLVQRHVGVAVAAQALLVAKRLGERPPEGDADILDGVMRVDVQVALGGDLEVDRAVAGDLVEHVVEEGTPVSNLPTPVPSRLSFTETWVSRVLRVISACRMDRGHKDGTSRHDTISTSSKSPPRRPMSKYWSATTRKLTPTSPASSPS